MKPLKRLADITRRARIRLAIVSILFRLESSGISKMRFKPSAPLPNSGKY